MRQNPGKTVYLVYIHFPLLSFDLFRFGRLSCQEVGVNAMVKEGGTISQYTPPLPTLHRSVRVVCRLRSSFELSLFRLPLEQGN